MPQVLTRPRTVPMKEPMSHRPVAFYPSAGRASNPNSSINTTSTSERQKQQVAHEILQDRNTIERIAKVFASC
ncbi:hypothetical protein Hypma_009101 [Hypsizygus marmoreus]|uniref:Uncharacterized protein n=1 Tax=Hypsizygus marmoreus TaxID=39966 RepID=A0A369JS13_HYPMA|nr:hypothetical protein Hypma_009101 [Hypsizygus marmoreus]